MAQEAPPDCRRGPPREPQGGPTGRSPRQPQDGPGIPYESLSKNRDERCHVLRPSGRPSRMNAPRPDPKTGARGLRQPHQSPNNVKERGRKGEGEEENGGQGEGGGGRRGRRRRRGTPRNDVEERVTCYGSLKERTRGVTWYGLAHPTPPPPRPPPPTPPPPPASHVTAIAAALKISINPDGFL